MSLSGKINFLFCLSLMPVLFLSCASAVSTANVTSRQQSVQLSGPADRVEVVYFHRHRRCEACIFAEQRIDYVIKTFFADEVQSGKLTFDVYDLGAKNSDAIASEYGAIGTQLFIKAISNGVDHIRHIQEIWYWGCIDNQIVFDDTVKNIVQGALYGKE